MDRMNAHEDAGANVEPELSPGDSRTDVSAPSRAGTEDTRTEPEVLLDRIARLQAEFENARKRWTQEQQAYREFAMEDALRTLLPVLDSLDRALKAPQNNPEQLRAGFELIQKQLQDALGKLGVAAIASEGDSFDPRYHQAVEMVDSQDAPGGSVVEELQRGYQLNGRLLRPAMVRVARDRKSA